MKYLPYIIFGLSCIAGMCLANYLVVPPNKVIDDNPDDLFRISVPGSTTTTTTTTTTSTSTTTTTTTSTSTTLVADEVHRFMFTTANSTQSDEIHDLDLTVTGATHDSGNGGHYSYDGSGDYITTSSHSDFVHGSSNWSVSVWAKHHTFNVYDTIWAESDASGRFGIQIPSAADQVVAFRYDGSYSYRESMAAVTSNIWNHYVMTHDTGGTIGFYINGTNQTDTTSGASTSGTTGHNCGARTDEWAGSHWNGLIDDLREYKRVVSAGEVLTLYAAGSITKSN